MGNRHCQSFSSTQGLTQTNYRAFLNRKSCLSSETMKQTKSSGTFSLTSNESSELSSEDTERSKTLLNCNSDDQSSIAFSSVGKDPDFESNSAQEQNLCTKPVIFPVSSVGELLTTSVIFHPCHNQNDCEKDEEDIMHQDDDETWQGFGVDHAAFDYRCFVTRRYRASHEIASLG